MQSSNLTRELSKRIFGNLGIIPDKIGSFGVTDPIFLLKEKIKFEEENSEITYYDIWAAENIIDNSKIKIILSNISPNNNEVDLVLLINLEDVYICLRYYGNEEDPGSFLRLYNDSWVEVDMIHKLNLTIATEIIVQNGLSWQSCFDYKDLHNTLISMLSTDDD